jgi:hypothetical protein
MPVVSVLVTLFSYLSFTQLSRWHRPVFLHKIVAYHVSSGAIAMGTRLTFLGLMQNAYYEHDTEGKEARSQPVVDKPEQPSSKWVNLGVVLKSSMIIETIDAYFKEKGLVIV